MTLKAAFFRPTLRYAMKILSHVRDIIQDLDWTIILDGKRSVTTECVVTKKVVVDEKLSVVEVRETMITLLETSDCVEDEMFEEEVRLEEVRKAFEVFDENKDGFIDAEEVKRVLCALGVMEASEFECNGMIKAFDNDGDGKINFKEFTKIIEDSFK